MRAVAAPRAPILLAASAVAASVTGTTNETTLATVTIPAGAMGTSGGVQINSSWSTTNSANTKTIRARFGGASGTAYLSGGVTTVASIADSRRIKNRGSADSQVGSLAAIQGGFGTSGAAVITSTVDTSAAVDLVFTGQLTNTGETITLENYEVWLLP